MKLKFVSHYIHGFGFEVYANSLDELLSEGIVMEPGHEGGFASVAVTNDHNMKLFHQSIYIITNHQHKIYY